MAGQLEALKKSLTKWWTERVTNQEICSWKYMGGFSPSDDGSLASISHLSTLYFFHKEGRLWSVHNSMVNITALIFIGNIRIKLLTKYNINNMKLLLKAYKWRITVIEHYLSDTEISTLSCTISSKPFTQFREELFYR